jgi:tetratricopeptide (TPR) repeat protein
MGSIQKFIFSYVLCLLVSTTFAQSNNLIPTFAKSIKLEKEREYISAINVLKENYNPKSYETNLRLGWLYYVTQQYSESKNYYNLAMRLLPNSLEAKTGYLYPIAAYFNK